MLDFTEAAGYYGIFAFLPLVGDALCLAAGWLRVNWPAALAFMAVGRLARYLLVAYASGLLRAA